MGPKTSSKSRGKTGCGTTESFVLLFIILFFIMNYSWIKGVVNSVFMRGNLQEGSSDLLFIDVKKIREYESLLNEASHLAATIMNKPFHHQDNHPVGLAKESPPPTTTAMSVTLPGSDSLSNNLRGVKTDLIIGMAQNTDPKNLAVFCKSIREVNKDTTVILFVNAPIPALHTKIANDNRIILKDFDLQSLHPYENYHPSTLRWPLLYDYFKDPSIRAKYRRVWMIDVRDSYFQADPFDPILDPDEKAFLVFHGVETILISQCGWNGGWVKDCFGKKILDDIGNNHIICSGVSLGDMESVFAYLTLMNDIITHNTESKNPLVADSKFPSCERNGVDQGIHNVLVHTNSIPNMKVVDQRRGLVMNMQAKRAQVINDKGTYSVRNSYDKVVSVVHQYDRELPLQQYLFGKYVDWVNTADPVEEFKQSSECRKYGYKLDVDMFKGVCDLSMAGGATSPSSCCSKCNNVEGCKGFTFYGNVCFLKTCSKSNLSPPLKGSFSGYSADE